MNTSDHFHDLFPALSGHAFPTQVPKGWRSGIGIALRAEGLGHCLISSFIYRMLPAFPGLDTQGLGALKLTEEAGDEASELEMWTSQPRSAL